MSAIEEAMAKLKVSGGEKVKSPRKKKLVKDVAYKKMSSRQFGTYTESVVTEICKDTLHLEGYVKLKLISILYTD